MKGTIKKRGKDTWSVIVDYPRDYQTGKRNQKWYTIKGNKREADRYLRELLNNGDKGIVLKNTKITVAEWLREWLNDYASFEISPVTLESYKSNVEKHIIPALGGYYLSQLEAKHIREFYAQELKNGKVNKSGGLSARTVMYHHRIISKALKQAVLLDMIARNVADLIKPPRISKKTMNTMSPLEVDRFLDVARETDYFVFFATLLYTGLRRGELLALRWRNLNLPAGKLTVVETAYKLDNGEYLLKEPKTASSRRSVTLPASLVELFKAYRADQELLRIQLGVGLELNDFVFIRPDGTPINPNAVTLAFKRILKRAGLKGYRVHDLRHTHATLMLMAGVHPKIVSERLGHASISITLDTYSHVLPSMQEEAAEKFDGIFDAGENENSEQFVSKMLAKNEDLRCRPYRSRTCDTLIKSQVLYQLS